MRVLLLGMSSIAERRVFPALAGLATVSQIDIASRQGKTPASWSKEGKLYTDYQEAMTQSEALLVYISLPNSEHEPWIEQALSAGKHVVVDKPAVLSYASAVAWTREAKRRGLLLAEATVFSFHPHVARMREFFREYGPITHVNAQFIIPPLPSGNFRNFRAMGGGCLNDMGPYAAAVARLFGAKPALLHLSSAPPSDIVDADVGFTLAAQFEGGASYVGQFSFEGEYQNRLLVVGRHGSVSAEQVFSPPPNAPILWRTRRKNVPGEEVQPAADAFASFLHSVIESVLCGEVRKFDSDMLEDARFREQLAAQNAHLNKTERAR
jgi:predicted dehydrogenase